MTLPNGHTFIWRANRTKLGHHRLNADQARRAFGMAVKGERITPGFNENSYSVDLFFRPVQHHHSAFERHARIGFDSSSSSNNKMNQSFEHHDNTFVHATVLALLLLYAVLGICGLLILLFVRRRSHTFHNLERNSVESFGDSSASSSPMEQRDEILPVISSSTLPQCWQKCESSLLELKTGTMREIILTPPTEEECGMTGSTGANLLSVNRRISCSEIAPNPSYIGQERN